MQKYEEGGLFIQTLVLNSGRERLCFMNNGDCDSYSLISIRQRKSF